jgi:hypothetical protein
MGRKEDLHNTPKLLSILIPSVETRIVALAAMLEKIHRQVDGRADVEVLSIIDTKTMTLGRKRNLLLDMAVGQYLTFINDDDDIAPNWLNVITSNLNAQPGVDVLSIRAECKMRLSAFQPWQHAHIMATSLACTEVGIKFVGSEPQLFLHKPVMWCVWRTEIARAARFPDRTYGEDNPWAFEACRLATTERVVPFPLYCYYADDSTSEAGPWMDGFNCGMDIITYTNAEQFLTKNAALLDVLGFLVESKEDASMKVGAVI